MHVKRCEHNTSRESVQSSQKSESSQMLMRMVKTAYLVQESHGQPVIEMLAVADKNFEEADDAAKISMIKYIQNLRLLVWLLRQDNLSTTARFYANNDNPGDLIKTGSLNVGYKRQVVSSEILRWRQFSLVQQLRRSSHAAGDSVSADSTNVVHSYFMSNDYGRDLFRFYLSLPRKPAQEPNEEQIGSDSNDPAWVRARRQRMSLFVSYLASNHSASQPLSLEIALPHHESEDVSSKARQRGLQSSFCQCFSKRVATDAEADECQHATPLYRANSTHRPIQTEENPLPCPTRVSTFDSAVDLSHDIEMSDANEPDSNTQDTAQHVDGTQLSDVTWQPHRPGEIVPHAIQMCPHQANENFVDIHRHSQWHCSKNQPESSIVSSSAFGDDQRMSSMSAEIDAAYPFFADMQKNAERHGSALNHPGEDSATAQKRSYQEGVSIPTERAGTMKRQKVQAHGSQQAAQRPQGGWRQHLCPEYRTQCKKQLYAPPL